MSDTFQPGDDEAYLETMGVKDAGDIAHKIVHMILDNEETDYYAIKYGRRMIEALSRIEAHTRPAEAKAVEAPYFMDQADEALFAIKSSSVGRIPAADTGTELSGDHSTDTSSREATPREEGTMRSAKEWVEVARRFDTMFVPTKNPPLAYLIRDIQKDALRSRLPPGLVMVPEEPSDEMYGHVFAAMRVTNRDNILKWWKAMLAACKGTNAD